ncbi:MAG: hypothetical protein AAF517_06575 [Planctomycetota bacterium]
MASFRETAPVVCCPSLPDGARIRRADVLAALDRPDRLEIDIVYEATEERADESAAMIGALRPESPIELWAGEDQLFSGAVERRTLRSDRYGTYLSAVAYSGYQFRRDVKSHDVYHRMSDSEIAAQLAEELGLEADVDRSNLIHERLERREDPLEFLRERARAEGFQLAIGSGRLHFRRQLEPNAGGLRAVDRRTGVRELELSDRGWRGRGGRLRVWGDATWRPLDELDLSSYGPAWDGRYLIVRCRHFVDSGGFDTEAEFLEEGADVAAWRGEVSAPADTSAGGQR